jgi:hypothetical protein
LRLLMVAVGLRRATESVGDLDSSAPASKAPSGYWRRGFWDVAAGYVDPTQTIKVWLLQKQWI